MKILRPFLGFWYAARGRSHVGYSGLAVSNFLVPLVSRHIASGVMLDCWASSSTVSKNNAINQ
jgi:hypothetical protein